MGQTASLPAHAHNCDYALLTSRRRKGIPGEGRGIVLIRIRMWVDIMMTGVIGSSLMVSFLRCLLTFIKMNYECIKISTDGIRAWLGRADPWWSHGTQCQSVTDVNSLTNSAPLLRMPGLRLRGQHSKQWSMDSLGFRNVESNSVILTILTLGPH